jgi:hypothetical protein
MKRFDRAMYALFLLALLADFARSQVPVSVGGDAAGGLILSAAQELKVGPGEVANLVLRRANGSLPASSKLKSRNWTMVCLSSALSGQLDKLGHPSLAILAAPSLADFDGPGSAQLDSLEILPPTRTVFAHTGSPAP